MTLHIASLSFCLLTSVISVAQNIPPPDSVNAHGKVFHKVEVEAAFPGGDAAWRNFLVKNLNGNTPVDNGAPSGKYAVVVKFVVRQDGSLTDIEAETNLGYGMEKEVIRLIKKSGKWAAAIMDGKTVSAYRRQPVTFLVEEDGIEFRTKVPYTLFTGVDNVISVDIRKVNSSNITLTISKGSITGTGDEGFIARVNEPGRVLITAYNNRNNKKIGEMSFEVKSNN